MLTLCLGGPMDGKLTDQSYPRFHVLDRSSKPLMLGKQEYRLEKFGWGETYMWVYLHEFLGEKQAMDELFGTRASHNTG
jgi:hypothetical protein